MHDLDFNRHVNNSIYPVWAMESVPADILYTHALQKIIINYISESLYGDRILSATQQLNSNPVISFLHSLASQQTQKEITRIKTVWQKNDDA
jgi:medium-chain acyl-[acyl-carrier-protein] hydrolase